jgi:hypothetical protein
MHYDLLEDALLRTLVWSLVHETTDSRLGFLDLLVLYLLYIDFGVLLDCLANVHEPILICNLEGCLAVEIVHSLDLDPSLQQELDHL